MSAVKASPSQIKGRAAAPPSKSVAHRALICAALSGGGSVRGVIDSDDMRATLGGLTNLGVQADQIGNTVNFKKTDRKEIHPVIDCIESGSTLRFLVPIYAALGMECTFIGKGRLPQRPLGVYESCLPQHGVRLEYNQSENLCLPLSLKGKLQAGKFDLPGNVSSQFITGLLFALPLCNGESVISLTTPLESAAYIDLTIDTLRKADIVIHSVENGWIIPGGQGYSPHDFVVEGDWSQAAFLLAMGALGGEITLTGADINSHQGDVATLDLMKRFGADITVSQSGIVCRRGALRGIEIDATQIPDLVPILATVGAAAKGVTTITGASRLRLKESDRLAAIARCLGLLGGRVKETDDGLIIEGVDGFQGGATLPGFNDHRIVMSMAAAALVCDSPVIIEDAHSVAKSWPEFFDVYRECGGEADVIQHRE